PPLHEAIGVARLAEAYLAVEPVGIPREEGPEAQVLKLGMAPDRGHDLLADAAAAMAVEHEHVGHVGERRPVADHAGEAHLATAIEGAEADRVADRSLHHLAGDARRPVGAGQEAVHGLEVEPG